MTFEEQLDKWVSGDSIHTDICCPDFSCCRPELKWPEEQRRLFRDRPEIRESMCMMSLAAALSGKPVYIAGFKQE